MSRGGGRQYDPAAALRGRRLPVESAQPGTTLGLIPMEASAAPRFLFRGRRSFV